MYGLPKLRWSKNLCDKILYSIFQGIEQLVAIINDTYIIITNARPFIE